MLRLLTGTLPTGSSFRDVRKPLRSGTSSSSASMQRDGVPHTTACYGMPEVEEWASSMRREGGGHACNRTAWDPAHHWGEIERAAQRGMLPFRRLDERAQ